MVLSAIAGIASGAGALASAFGGKKGQAPAQQGFAALPKKVQDAYLETYLPAVLEQYEQPFQPIPMQRAVDTGDPFQSQALLDLQQFSDDVGGLFTPLNPEQQAAEEQPVENRDSILEMIDFVVNRPKGNVVGSNLRHGFRANQLGEELEVNPASVTLSDLIGRL